MLLLSVMYCEIHSTWLSYCLWACLVFKLHHYAQHNQMSCEILFVGEVATNPQKKDVIIWETYSTNTTGPLDYNMVMLDHNTRCWYRYI